VVGKQERNTMPEESSKNTTGSQDQWDAVVKEDRELFITSSTAGNKSPRF